MWRQTARLAAVEGARRFECGLDPIAGVALPGEAVKRQRTEKEEW
jgi:hypothetical protein